jgi:hypothetical protein
MMKQRMRSIATLCAAFIVLSAPAALRAWSMDGHRYLTRRALENMPAELAAFLAPKIDFVSEHAADPDLWRVMGLAGLLGPEPPNHYLDLDALDEPPPFTNVPRDWTKFVERYGADRANRAGRLPWRVEETFNKLVATFQDIGKSTAPYAADDSRYLIAVLSHYIEDAHVPFHATGNHDGDMTNQHGIHARFESELVARNLSSLKLAPVVVTPIPGIRAFIFDTLATSQSLVAPVLDADRAAKAGRDAYDDVYYAKFFSGARPILERRMSEATSAVVSAVESAWERAGKPKLPGAAPRRPLPIAP